MSMLPRVSRALNGLPKYTPLRAQVTGLRRLTTAAQQETPHYGEKVSFTYQRSFQYSNCTDLRKDPGKRRRKG